VAAEAWARAEPGRSAPGTAAEAFVRLSETIPALGGMTHADLGLTGRLVEAAPAVAAP
jgi:hypothetical protein